MPNNMRDGPEIVEVDKGGNVIEPEAFKRKSGRGRLEEGAAKTVYSEELIDECRDVGIEEFAIRAGGDYRQLGKKKVYWFPLPELLDFERKDIETEDNDEFWDWFTAYVEDHKLQTKSERTQKQTKSWRDWKPDWEMGWGNRKIGSWWSDWGYNSFGSSSDSALTKKLAIALKAVNTTVSVINDTAVRFRVQLASESEDQTPTSYTSFNEKKVVVSPAALLDNAIDSDKGIEVTTGFALHEASHVKYSASLIQALTKPSELKPLTVAQLLWNILEDIRIEDLTATKFPGFAEYFDTHNAYLWDLQEKKMPRTWGPELNDKVNSVIGMTKWPKDYEPIVSADADLAAEFPWWLEWRANYLDGTEPIRMGVIRALERLAQDEKTKQQMQDLADAEDALRKQMSQPLSDDEFRQMMEGLKELLNNGIDPCPSPGGGNEQGQGMEVTLTDEQAAELDKLIQQQFQTHEAFYKMHDGTEDAQPEISSLRPQETEGSKAAYNPPGSMVERLRSVFYFRKTQITESERLLKAGFVDDEQLFRVGFGDSRVFERQMQPEETFTSVTMLVDASGSMIGEGLEKAQELANVMLACLRTQRGVRVRVRAHSTGREMSTSVIYRIWEPGDPDTRIGLLTTIDHGSNWDGFAIDWCAQELDRDAQPGEQKLLIVLSDGLPAGNGFPHYGGAPAMAHMKEVSRGWGRKGVPIVQIAVDPDGVRPEDQAAMFEHWIGYETDQRLLVDLTKLLAKTFGGEA